MGNSLPLPSCACHHCCCCCCCHDEVNNEVGVEAGTAVSVSGCGSGGGKKRRKKKQLQQRPAADDRGSRNAVRAARTPRHVVVPVVDDSPEDGDGDGDGGRERELWPECRVERAGHGEGGGGVVRVRIVMKRKDIPQLVARLEERNATAARIEEEEEEEEEVSTELGGCSGNGNGGGGGGTMTSPCRDGWRPRLSIIPEKENY